MTPTHLTEALHELRDAVAVPPVDQVAFRARVREQRRRRTTRRVAGGAVAAGLVAAALVVGPGRTDGGADRGVEPAGTQAVATARVDETLFFIQDGRLASLDPRGVVHDLGLASEGIVGFTSERVYALDDDSHVVVRGLRRTEEGAETYVDEPSPVSGPVAAARLSGDTRWLAWEDLDAVVHRYDLKAGREDLRLPLAGPDEQLVGVSGTGVLVNGADGLSLRDGDTTLAIPATGPATGAQLAGDHVLTVDDDGVSRLYDVAGGTPEPVVELPGSGLLGPYAERVAVRSGGDAPTLTVWDGVTVPVRGLEGAVRELRWAGEATLVVATDTATWACDIDLACARLPLEGPVDLG